MIRVHRLEISKAQLAAVPSDERALMLLSGHTLNMLGVWIKLIRFSTNRAAANPVEARIGEAQSQIILRSLFGVIAETWEWLRRPESQRLVGRKYLPMMPEEAAEAYASLKRSFGGSGLLHNLRNRFSYHHPSTDDLARAFTSVPEDADWSWYVASDHTNSLYLSCETVVGYGVAGLASAADANAGFAAILRETITVANALNAFITSLLALAVRSNFGETVHPSPSLEVTDAPDGREFVLPFFAEGV